MKRLAYLFPTVFLGFGLTGCPDDVGGVPSETESDEDGDSGDEDTSASDPTSVSMTTMSTSMSETGDPTTDTETMGDSTTTTGDECSIADGDECETADDCPTSGASCVQCLCIGGTGGDCEEWGADSGYEDCSEGQACPAGSVCLSDPTPGATGAVCTVINNCMDRCDCPQPPAGFEDQVACDPVKGDMMGDCYINCEGGAECPDGMYCALGFICAGGMGGPTLPPYGDCFNMDKGCEDGAICFPGGTYGFCSDLNCMDDCPDHEDLDATAVPTCATLLNDGMMDIDACYLDCSGGETCPDGMVCQELFAGAPDGCVWTEINYGYGDCINFGEALECLTDPAESCFTAGLDPDEGHCAVTDCSDPTTDCPQAETGDADPACVDIDGAGGDECVLDCSGGETCPDGMTCGTNMYCVWIDALYCDQIVDPSFELGNDDWTQASTNFGTPLCDQSCGADQAVHGDWYVWFGGVDMSAMGATFPEVGSVEQDVTIPANASNLRFMIDFAVVTDTNPGDDYVRILIDDTEEWIATGDDADMFTPYGEVLVDLTAGGYNDDGVHTITIESSIEGDEITSIFVDDVFIICDG